MTHSTCPLIQKVSRTVWNFVFRVLLGSDLESDGIWIASDTRAEFLATHRVSAS